MKSIWKYQLTIAREQTIRPPKGAKIIHTGLDPTGELCLWAEVDTHEEGSEPLLIRIYGTGHMLYEVGQRHLGSVVIGDYVWHVYIVT